MSQGLEGTKGWVMMIMKQLFLHNSNFNCYREKQSRLSERYESMRMTSELTLGWKKPKVFTRLLMRPLLKATRTKCTRLSFSLRLL